MPNTADSAHGGSSTNTENLSGCVEGCLDLAPLQIYSDDINVPGRTMTVRQPQAQAGNLLLNTVNNPLHLVLPDGALGSQCGRTLGGKLWIQRILIGDANYFINYASAVDNFRIFAGQAGRTRYFFTFDVPVDIRLTPVSFFGGAGTEVFYINQPCDEYLEHAAGLSTLPSQVGATGAYSDTNDGAGSEAIIYRGITSLNFDMAGDTGIRHGIFITILMSNPGFVERQCRVPLEISPPCAGAETAETELMCEQIIADANWFSPFETGSVVNWEFSQDAGVTWGPAPDALVAVPNGAVAGRFRWRTQFTIPDGYHGFWRVHHQGDTNVGTAAAQRGSYFYDGIAAGIPYNYVDIGVVNPGGGQRQAYSSYVAVTPGVHTFEFRLGAVAVGNAQIMPNFRPDYRAVRKVKTPFQRHRCLDNLGAVISEQFFDYLGNPFVPTLGTHIQTVGDCDGLAVA